MNIKTYIRDQAFVFIFFFLMCILIYIFMIFWHINQSLIFFILGIIFVFFLFTFFYNFYQRKSFYTHFDSLLNELDQKFLICEMVKEPSFLEGKILYNALYDINKSMMEEMNELHLSVDEFKDYVEMWIHEVKIPLSHLNLSIYNHQFQSKPSILEQVHKIENQVDQVLYYVRSQSAQKDYLIKSISLSQIIKNVIKKNKDYFIYHKVKVILNNLDYNVYTDSKWLEFILNQILNNSFQYTPTHEAIIDISAMKKDNQIVLFIQDNGIGIQKSDLPRVFDKSFTGHNGRIQKKSTGMGLYICKKLCQQLGHHISIDSKINQYTKVIITFYDDHYYDVMK